VNFFAKSPMPTLFTSGGNCSALQTNLTTVTSPQTGSFVRTRGGLMDLRLHHNNSAILDLVHKLSLKEP
jgi:hypothetical protein